MIPRFYGNNSIKKLAGFVILFSFFFVAYALACPPEDPPPNSPPTEVGDPVSVTSGKVRSSQQDLLIPGRGGLSLEISRDYYSKNDYFSSFGRGWSFTYGMYIMQDDPTTATLVNENGKREKYTWDGNSWVPPTGNFSTLTKNQDEAWIVKRKDGIIYNFDTEGKLINITDRNDNQISLVYTNGLLVSVTDDNGRALTFSYIDGRITSITWPNNEVTTYTYDPNADSLATVTDPEGNQISYGYGEYNGSWELTTVTDRCDNVVTYVYYDIPEESNYLKCKRIIYPDETPLDPNDNPRMDLVYNESLRFTLVTNERGYTTKYDYDGNENITIITDPLNIPVTYAYDDDFNKISVTNARGTTSFDYDDKGNCTSITDPLDRTVNFTYEPVFSFIKTATDAKQNTTTYYYDYEEASLGDLNADGITNQENGNLVKIIYPTVDAGTPAELFVYNQYGQIIQQTAASGTITKYDYYATTGYLQTKTSDYGDTTHINSVAGFTYDALGNVTSVTDSLGNTTVLEYNKIGLLLKSISPAPFNYQTKYTYNGNKKLTKIERQLNEIGSDWQVTENVYDSRNRLVTIKEYLSESDYITTTFHYDLAGNKDSQTDGNGNTTTYTYDERDLLIKTTDAEGNQTEYTYYEDRKLHTIKDAETNVTTYDYDNSGWLIKTTYPDGSYEEYTPDLNSNIASKRTRKGDIITYSYDNLNHLKTKVCTSYPTVTYTYDIASRLISVVASGSEAISYQYDNLNRVLQTTTDNKTIDYQYDNASNRTKLTYPDTAYITYSYDNLNRLTFVIASGSEAISYTYDTLSRRTALTLPNSVTTSYTYDNLNRLMGVIPAQAGIQSFTYTYDNASNRLSMTTQEGTHSYDYDNIYQIKDVNYPDGYSFSDTSYEYDGVGNRTVAAGETYIPNNLNQYTQVGAVTYSYDNNANLASDGVFTYTYDYENRLVSASKTGTTATYTYDPFGRRIKKEITINGQSSTVNYIHDGNQVIAEYDASDNLTRTFVNGPNIDEVIYARDHLRDRHYYYHYDGLGSVVDITNENGYVVEHNTYTVYGKADIKLSGDFDHNSVINAFDYSAFSYAFGSRPGDANWNPECDLDGNGVINAFDYSAFSYLFGNTRSNVNPYYFTGRELDQETNLYYYRARYYNPLIGRFITTDYFTWGPDDPRGFRLSAFFSSQTGYLTNFKQIESNIIETWKSFLVALGRFTPYNCHRYMYARNNPLNLKDPFGLWTASIGIGTSGGVGGGGSTSTSLSFDDNGNFAVTTTNAAGGYGGAGGSSFIQAGWTNADTVSDLQGQSMLAGGSGTILGISAGGEYVTSPGGDIQGVNVNVGVGIGVPIEEHALLANTTVLPLGENQCENK